MADVAPSSFDESVVDAFVSDLAAAGVAVYPLGSAAPVLPIARPLPLRLTDEQAANAALGAHFRSGVTGADIDSLVSPGPLADGAQPLPASLLIAAWAQSAESEAALMARRLLGEQDWTNYEAAIFPVAVLTLFAADVVAGVPPSEPSDGTGVSPLRLPPAAAPAPALVASSACQEFQGFIDGTITEFFSAIGRLRFDESTGDRWLRALEWVGNHLLDPVKYAIDTAKFVVLLGPLLSIVQSVASVVAVVSAVLLALQPWTGEITPEPLVANRSGSPSDGRLDLVVRTVGLGADRWPAHIEGCAQWAGVTLPSLTPRDADVAWSVEYQHPEPMIATTHEDLRLDSNGMATMAYETVVEPPDIAAGDLQHDGSVKVSTTIHRKDLDGVRDRLLTGLWNSIPLPKIVADTLTPALRAIIEPHITRALAPLTKLTDTTAYTVLATTYHTKRDDDPAPPSSSPPAGSGVAVHHDAPWIPGYIDLVSCDGPYGTWNGVISAGETAVTTAWEVPVSFELSGKNNKSTLSYVAPGYEIAGEFVWEVWSDGSTLNLFNAEDWEPGFPPITLPITPAPAGQC